MLRAVMSVWVAWSHFHPPVWVPGLLANGTGACGGSTSPRYSSAPAEAPCPGDCPARLPVGRRPWPRPLAVGLPTCPQLFVCSLRSSDFPSLGAANLSSIKCIPKRSCANRWLLFVLTACPPPIPNKPFGGPMPKGGGESKAYSTFWTHKLAVFWTSHGAVEFWV